MIAKEGKFNPNEFKMDKLEFNIRAININNKLRMLRTELRILISIYL